MAALKGNQPNLFKDVKTNFTPEFTYEQINKGHGRIEKRHVSICQKFDGIPPWPGLTTLIQVKSERQVFTHNMIEVTNETRYYISSLSETAQSFAERIRGYWAGLFHSIFRAVFTNPFGTNNNLATNLPLKNAHFARINRYA